jgi:hypothetical protein
MKLIAKGLMAFVVLAFTGIAVAQDGIPMELLKRTFAIQAGTKSGTAFSIEYKGMAYVVTARHVVSELPAKNATVKLLKDEQWLDVPVVQTIFPESPDVDIAVLDLGIKAPYSFKYQVGKGAMFGQQLWFLGFPYGLRSNLRGPDGMTSRFPFIKRGTMSAVDGSNPDAPVMYIDGFNNPGFSGGPIIAWDHEKQTYTIIGVVMGYRPESAKVAVNGDFADTGILVNSGILIGYALDPAIKAIEKSLQNQPPTTAPKK